MKSVFQLTSLLLIFFCSHAFAQEPEAESPNAEEPAATEESAEPEETQSSQNTSEEPAATNTLTIQEAPQQKTVERPLRELVNELSATDIQTAIQALRGNYVEQQSLDELELNRAAMEGLLLRLGFGAVLTQSELVDQANGAGANGDFHPSYEEILNEKTSYLRLGILRAESLEWLQQELAKLAELGVDEVVLDLRDTPTNSDYELASQLADLFIAKGEPLLSIDYQGEQENKLFTSREDPQYKGLLTILTDKDTGGAAEVIAAVLRDKAGAMIIGMPTQDRAVLYEQVQLGDNLVLQIATGRVSVAGGEPVFPGGVKPDVHVDLPQDMQARIFQLSRDQGMGPFILEQERQRLNEAALVAERNPDIDLLRQIRYGSPDNSQARMRDLVLQRALDFLTTLRVFQGSRYLAAPAGVSPQEDEPEPSQP